MKNSNENNHNELVNSFILAVGFMSRLPTPMIANPTDKAIANTPFFYPWVGVIIGVLLVLIGSISFIDDFLLVTLVVTAWVLITGALHLDGLADFSDALIGGLGNKTKTKQILKDPHLGVHGVVSIVLVLLVKCAAVYSLLQQNSLIVLFLTPILARLFILPLIAKTNYYETNGIAATIFNGADKASLNHYFYIVLTLIGLFVLVFFSCDFGNVVIAATIIAGLAIYLRKTTINRLDGISGDVLGAAIELFEVVFLVSFLIL